VTILPAGQALGVTEQLPVDERHLYSEGYLSGGPMYLGGEEIQRRSYAEATQRVIDEEVAKLLRQAEQRATALLTKHRDALDRLTELLLERETVDGTDVDEILGRVPGRQAVGTTGHATEVASATAPRR